jgi:hypothetical protein
MWVAEQLAQLSSNHLVTQLAIQGALQPTSTPVFHIQCTQSISSHVNRTNGAAAKAIAQINNREIGEEGNVFLFRTSKHNCNLGTIAMKGLGMQSITLASMHGMQSTHSAHMSM